MPRAAHLFLAIALLGAIAGCSDSAETRSEGLGELQAIKARWERSLESAKSAPASELGVVAQDLHQIRRELDTTKTSECLAGAREALAAGMDAVIAEVLLQLGGGGDGGLGLLLASISAARFEDSAQLCAMSMHEAADFLAARARELQQVRQEEERKIEEEHAAIDAAISAASVHCASASAPREPGSEFSDALAGGARGPLMVVLPCGGFLMGSTSNADEEPVHPVSMRSFALAKTELTFEEYDLFAQATGRTKPADEGWGRGRQPVVNVSWADASAYAAWLSEQTGARYRLPSEAEWEYAARAGSHDDFAWGYDIGYNRANCDGCGSPWDNRQPAPVGSFPANTFGLQDMHGNVWEWVQDCYIDSHEGAPADGSAREQCDPQRRIIRGSSWFGVPSWVRAAHRSSYPASTTRHNGGFRVARELP